MWPLHSNKHFVFLILTCALLSSCATVMNDRTVDVTVHTVSPSVIKHNGYTYNTKTLTLHVPRQKQPIKLDFKSDSASKTIRIKPYNSFAYYFNIYGSAGIGMLVERNAPKRYGYPRNVYLTAAGETDLPTNHWRKNKTGDVRVHYSFPYVNYLSLQPDNEPAKNRIGFIGNTIGLDYFHNNKQYLNLSASGVTTFFLPFPAPYRGARTNVIMSSVYLTLSNNHQIQRFSVGYGLAFARNTWDYGFSQYRNTSTPIADTIARVKTNHVLGTVFSGYYRLTPNFNIGILYRPTFIRFNTPEKFKYEHLLSIDFGWKINLSKSRD